MTEWKPREEGKEGEPDQEEDEIAAAHRAVSQDAVKESYAEPVKSVKELSAAEKGIGFQGFEAQTRHLTAEQLEKWTNEAAKVKGLPAHGLGRPCVRRGSGTQFHTSSRMKPMMLLLRVRTEQGTLQP